MNLDQVRRVFSKELRETLRDRRTLVIMIVVPVFLYPIMLVVGQQLAMFGMRQLEEEPIGVVVQGAPPEALAILARDTMLDVVAAAAGPEQVVEGRAEIAVVFPDGVDEEGQVAATIHYDGTRDRSQLGRPRVVERLEEWSDTVLARRLVEQGLPPTFAEPVTIAESSVASAERMGGYALGRFMPMVLILMTLLGAFYPAIDLSAGEKERGTLETLLTTPVPARELVAGKFLTVALVALCSAGLNLASMLLTIQFATMQLSSAMEISFSLPWQTILMLVLLLVPLAVLFSALFLGMALRAQSFKEAQNSLTPVQIATMLPMMLPLVPGIPFSYAVALMPVGGVAMLFRELMTGGAPPGPSLVALLATIAYAALALRFATRSFGREEVLFGTGGGSRAVSWKEQLRGWRARSGVSVPRPAEALAFIAFVALVYFYGGVALQVRAGEVGLLASQLLLLAMPAAAFALLGPYRSRDTLALRAPSARALFAGLLVILGGMPIAWALTWLQSFVLEVPEEFFIALEELVRADTPAELLWLLFLIALTPAICEELVFRGVLLQGLASEMTGRRAIIGSAIIFGAFHLSTATAIRFLPTLWLGLLLGYVVWRTRSIFTGMMMHFVNNGLIVLIVAYPALEAQVLGADDQPRWSLVLIGAVLLAAGMRLLGSGALGGRESPGERVAG